MNNLQPPFSSLMQSNSNEDTDTPKSLLDLINTHKKQSELSKNYETGSLADLTSKHLRISGILRKESDSPATSLSCHVIPKTVDGRSDSKQSEKDEFSEFKTLEEYTKSFLNSKGYDVLQYRKKCPPTNIMPQILKKETTDTQLTNINEKISNCRIEDSEKQKIRKIDLTVALQNKSKNNISPKVQRNNQVKQSVFAYPVKECNTDLSALVEEKLFYSDGKLSSLGYVISRKWKGVSLPKRFRKIGKTPPYNIAKSFKFDTPSPDDSILKTRRRENSTNDINL